MKTQQEIQQMLDEKVNTLLATHGGKAEITALDRSSYPQFIPITIAYVKMSGGCKGCAGARYTLNMIVSNHIKEFDPTVNHVVDITDHTDKTNAFYKE